ncbi:MAG: class E sortase [Actinomycetes bacterium]
MRTLARGFGQLLITLGLVVLLFCVYELWWTGVVTHQAQGSLEDRLRDDWSHERGQVRTKDFDLGSGVGLLSIPRLGRDWSWVVVEGVTPSALKDGPGHYPGTAMPGRVGNFGVAGHRATNGEPFAHLDAVRRGDSVSVETARAVYRYRVERTEITSPTNVDVVAPVPGKPGKTPHRRRITLTTCHPRWASTYRLIVYGVLDSVDKKPTGRANALGE